MYQAKLVCPVLLTLVSLACSASGPAFPDATDETDGSTSDGSTSSTTTGADAPAGTTGSSTTESPPPDDTTTGPDDGSTGEVFVPCETQCIGQAPQGWQGPDLLADVPGQLDSVSCDGDFDSLGMLGYTNLNAPAPSCDCDCGTPTNAVCDGSVRIYRRSQVSGTLTCGSNIAGPYNPQPGVVLDIPNVASEPLTAWNADYTQTPRVEGGSCEPSSTESIGPAEFARTIFTCGADLDATGCEEDQWCQPSTVGDDDHMCIWQQGETSCPADSEYTSRYVTYQGFTDTRSCSSCSCGDVEGSCEDASVRLLSTQLFTHQAEINPAIDCNFVLGSELDGFDISAVFFDAGDPVASCSPSGGDPTGTVSANGPTTVCCTP